jgi:uncharacterized membrane protein (UPF0127 family)
VPPVDRHARLLLWAAAALVALGVAAFVVRGADEPADPFVEPVTTTATAATVPGETVPAASAETAPSSASSTGGDPARVPLDGFDEVLLSVTPADGGSLLQWCLLAAARAEQRARGLMGVTDLQGYSGMAFLYDEDVKNAFYMRNTPTPLSIAWIDADGRLVSTAEMAPCEDREGCPTYPPAGPYRVAVEVFQGGLDDLGIVPGATMAVGGSCTPRA